MGKFNKTISRFVINHEGYKNNKKSVKDEIVDTILTSMLKGDNFYETDKDRVERVFNTIKNNPKYIEFFMKAMIYTRKYAYLRSISHVVAVALTETAKGHKQLKQAIKNTILRPDDASEMVALHQSRNNYKLPNALRKAIKESLEEKWNIYHFRKYQMKNKDVKLVDLVNLTHPREYVWQSLNNTDEKPFKMILTNSLPNINTAETVNASLKDEERHNKYYEMIKNRTLGYMALIKNINKMLPKNEEELDLLVNYITDKRLINNSKILPKRFVTVYFILQKEDFRYKCKVLQALEDAFVSRVKDMDFLDNKNVSVVIDVSASMFGEPLLNAVTMTAMLLSIKKDLTVYAFASKYEKLDTFGLSPFAFIDKHFKNSYSGIECKFDIGYGTEIGSALEAIAKEDYSDYVFVLTDMQLYNTYLNYDTIKDLKRKAKFKTIVLWDLVGYDKGTPFRVNRRIVLSLSGFSDKILENLKYVLKKKSLVDVIEKIDINKGGF